jgi:serine phosphatase RsbU (regulator of sigma subunit)
LTLITDGVLEARSKSGELFGFERTAAITKNSAAAILDRAQEFGQNDDITVLTITRLPAKKTAFVDSAIQQLSPSPAAG